MKVELKKSPFEISVSGPDKAIVGNDIEYIYSVKNKDKQKMGTLQFSPSFEGSFFISTSDPKLDKNDYWVIDTNTSTNEWTFTIKGRFASTTAKIASATGLLSAVLPSSDTQYKIAEKKISTKLEQNNLQLSLAINGKTKNFQSAPGEILNFTVHLRNSSHDDLENVMVELEIDAPSANNRSIMDWANIKDKYDADITGTQLNSDLRRGELDWNKKMIPSLDTMIPNDEISIDVTLPIRDINKFDLTQLKGYEITVSANATYKDTKGQTKRLSSNPINITMNSDLKLEVRNVKTTNKNGDEEHKVKWILTNNFHELKDVTVTADVYGKTSWKLDTKEPAGVAEYNKDQVITWKIEKMPLSLDTYALPFTITRNEKNQTQQTLVTAVKVEATDTITGEKITLTGSEIKLK